MNEHEIERVAAAMNQLRPDWPTKSLRTLLSKPPLADRPRRDVTVALAWVACESGTATPARVLEAGPWWKAAGVEGATHARRHVAPDQACRRCGQEMTDSCCDFPTRRPVTTDTTTHAAATRVLLHTEGSEAS